MDWFLSNVPTLVVVVACLLLLKFVLNLSKYLRTRWFHRRYKKWLSLQGMKLRESRGQVVKLFKEAGVKDSHVSVARHIGFGKLSIKEVSVFANFPNPREDFAAPILAMFRETIGTYRARMLETFSPLYWIETLINLPRALLSYLGVPAENVLVRVLQVVWWAVGLVLTTLLALYTSELRAFTEGWF